MHLSKMLPLAFAVPVLLTITGCWSQFRGGAAHTGYNPYENILSTSNVAGLGNVWRGKTGGSSGSSPAVAIELINGSYTGVVYVASDDGYLYAFNAFGCTTPSSCLPIWQPYHLSGPYPNPTYSYSSPAVAEVNINGIQTSVVYVTSWNDPHFNDASYLYAIDATKGTLIWTIPIGESPAYSSPAVVNGIVYVVTGGLLGFIYAVDAANGNLLWSGGVSTYYPSPAVSNGIVYAGDDFGTFYAYSTSCSGLFCTPLWTSISGLGAFKSSAAAANGVVYVGSDDGNLYAFDAAGLTNCTGTVCTPLWTGPTKGAVASSPAVANGVVYVGSDDGNLYAFDAAGLINCTGKLCKPLMIFTTNNVGGNYFASSRQCPPGGFTWGHLMGISTPFNLCRLKRAAETRRRAEKRGGVSVRFRTHFKRSA